ncbi:MAG: LptF/LptG family permease [Acidobacteria bacterium]|nr:LptF/LptG family permease [Acidobacteriota bacterium]
MSLFRTMCGGGRLVERYVLGAIVPYFFLTWLLLTAVLLAQQVGKFAELLGISGAPLGIALEVALGIIPNVSVFTLPMAMLVGTAAAFGRMGSDSEIVSMRAAGAGTLRIVSPVFLLGLILTLVCLANSFELAPNATQSMRRALLRATLHRLDSPVQPRTFNTQLPGKVIYVRDGDETSGQWGRVFIHWLEPGRELRLVTARSGRIDLTGEQSELVLSDAMVTTLPADLKWEGAAGSRVVTERSAQLRVRLNTGRAAIIRQLEARPSDPDELNWGELRDRLKSPTRGPQSATPDPALKGGNKEQGEAEAALAVFHKRLALCTTPLAFALLGVGLGLRAKRGGRGLAVVLSILSMLLFYFLFLGGDYLGRIGAVPLWVGVWLATAVSLVAGIGLLLAGERDLFRGLRNRVKKGRRAHTHRATRGRSDLRSWVFPTLLDRTIISSLSAYFLLSLVALVGVFLIFTVFELLRFLALADTGGRIVLAYLWYLIPLAVLGVSPICMLVATLVTYSLMARRSEAVSWWASGQSIYRIALPAIVFALLACSAYWLVQERVLPDANRRQEMLRTRIRGGRMNAVSPTGTQWLATDDRIYGFKFGAGSDLLEAPSSFEFDGDRVHILRALVGERGQAAKSGGLNLERVIKVELSESGPGRIQSLSDYTIHEPLSQDAFKPSLKRPSELNTLELSKYIRLLESQGAGASELTLYSIIQKRRAADPLALLVVTFVSIPLAIMFGKRSAVLSLLLAVIIGLAFWGGVSLFQHLGNYGLIPPTLAAFSLPLLFTTIGIYILSRVRT